MVFLLVRSYSVLKVAILVEEVNTFYHPHPILPHIHTTSCLTPSPDSCGLWVCQAAVVQWPVRCIGGGSSLPSLGQSESGPGWTHSLRPGVQVCVLLLYRNHEFVCVGLIVLCVIIVWCNVTIEHSTEVNIKCFPSQSLSLSVLLLFSQAV